MSLTGAMVIDQLNTKAFEKKIGWRELNPESYNQAMVETINELDPSKLAFIEDGKLYIF